MTRKDLTGRPWSSRLRRVGQLVEIAEEAQRESAQWISVERWMQWDCVRPMAAGDLAVIGRALAAGLALAQHLAWQPDLVARWGLLDTLKDVQESVELAYVKRGVPLVARWPAMQRNYRMAAELTARALEDLSLMTEVVGVRFRSEDVDGDVRF